MTSADCASRVPYCSALGFCHGGRLPFDEQQLEIEEGVFSTEPEGQPQGGKKATGQTFKIGTPEPPPILNFLRI